MCGLAGMARIDGRELSPAADQVLAAMAHAVAHRGPDDTRILRDGPVGLAFTRLSLVDTDGGGQPLLSPDGDVVLIANGEIYNHRELEATLPSGVRLRTRSDCEVLVHLYQRDGLRFLDKVRGMFGLVLWDRRRNVLLLARDQFGIKPLSYSRNRERIVFGSEYKALWQDPATPRGIDWEGALPDPVLSGAPVFTTAPVNTWFSGIAQVPPGTIISIDLDTGAGREHRYWTYPDAGPCDASDAELVAEYQRILAESIAECAIAEGDVGVFLSGGVDSAIVASIAKDFAPIHSFTALCASTALNGDARAAAQTARVLGISSDLVSFGAGRLPGVDEWKRLLWLTETPQCGPEAFYKYELHRYAKHRVPGLKAMLLGQASDDFNGGYSGLLADGDGWDGFVAAARGMALGQAYARAPGLAQWGAHFPLPVLTDDAVELASGIDVADPYDAFVRWKKRDITQYNCWHEDRTAGGNGIEARVPFLHPALVELTAQVPRARRDRLFWDKRILRDGIGASLPEEIANRPKGPFFYGNGVRHTHEVFTRMLLQDDRALVHEALSGHLAARLVDARRVHAVLDALEKDVRAGDVEFLLRLLNLGLLDTMAASDTACPVDRPRAAVPTAVRTEGFDDRSWERLAETITAGGWTPRPGPGEVYHLAGNVLLLYGPSGDEVYVLVDGSVEYTLDAAGSPDEVAFLRALDGRRTLSEVLAVAGLAPGATDGLLRQCLDEGIVVRSTRTDRMTDRMEESDEYAA